MNNILDADYQGDILIIDDEPNNLDVLSTSLECYGYQVRQAVTADIALKTIKLKAPDLILLDVIMPKVDGYELCKQLKSNPNTKEIPIIFLSALSQEHDKGKGFELGAVDFISKPFHLEEILARINHQLTIRKLETKLKETNQELEEHKYRLQTEIYLREKIEEELKNLQHLPMS
ncbi:MAG: response regulator [Mastigocoleus sp. MO_167.B18]|uniref:response regulator n=1 Tax=Mastigocoleus sp. MO_188.B34 TaxID=3036635 RepID=UPI0026226F1E|nr:response regulator [Mastigocoleus sp. MO_188.B34]MDJ0696342.1 response regulator [Mastigocoleus sp. MO_188.B34]MDJ0773926.1 response regulator [Mastigocoleus sp. MO_167.B18]